MVSINDLYNLWIELENALLIKFTGIASADILKNRLKD